MELYVNNNWTQRYGEACYVAEAVAYSENGNHVTVYAVGLSAEEADAKLLGALAELGLVKAKECS